MKKFLYSAFAASMMLIAASCSSEEELVTNGVGADEGQAVSFTIETGAVESRAAGEGLKVNEVHYEVWSGNELIISTIEGRKPLMPANAQPMANGKATVKMNLVRNVSYDISFWAQNKENNPYTISGGLDNITYTDLTQLVANKEEYDAFYHTLTGFKIGQGTQVVKLQRPFAQVNVGTTVADFDNAKALGVEIKKSEVKVTKVHDVFNARQGVATGEEEITFALNDLLGETFKIKGSDIEYQSLGMNYLFAEAATATSTGKTLHELTIQLNTDNTVINTLKVTNMPMQRNWRTNIVGNLLTGNEEFQIIVDPIFAGEYNDIHVWDGETIHKPYFNDADKTWVITTAAELAWVASATTKGVDYTFDGSRTAGEPHSFKGETVKLSFDIDLNGKEWTPIGNSTTKFQGTFDGQGHTIKNLVISTGNDYVGLFGYTIDGEIKNFKVENAKVKGRVGTGVVAGSPYTSKYSNITLKGHVEVNGMSYVGAVGGRNAYANWNNIIVDVDDTSYVDANSVENGIAYRTYVGGVIGFCGEGNHSFKNITSNINVKGSTIDVGGIVGIAHYGNTFENVTCTGNVEIYGAESEADAQEIGGIAGVWMNSSEKSPVTFNKCTFDGELKANGGFVINTNKFGNLVCAAYKTDGPGKLIIDGVEYMQTTNGVTIDGVSLVETSENLVVALENGQDVVLANDVKIDPAGMSNAYGTTGINVKNGQTIDGGGHTLDIQGAGGTWDSGINTTGGLIKNITVTGSFRGIFINHNSSHKEKVVLENVIIDGTTYTISCDQGTNEGLEAKDCTFNGWTSYAKTLGNAKFTDCKFGEGNGYAYCRPYAPTEFIGCEFEEGYKMDPRAAVTFKDCTIGGVALTADNLSTLVISNIANATVK